MRGEERTGEERRGEETRRRAAHENSVTNVDNIQIAFFKLFFSLLSSDNALGGWGGRLLQYVSAVGGRNELLTIFEMIEMPLLVAAIVGCL